MCGSCWTAAGAALAAIAVGLGAWAAHGLDRFCLEKYPPATTEAVSIAGLETPLAWKRLNDFRTGADYQMAHSLGLILVGLMAGTVRSRWLSAAGWLFVIGIVGFSGSLYSITLTGERAFGAVAPIGGTAFILGWIALAGAACRRTAP